MSISDNIKRIRSAHSLTQSQLGEIAGVSDKAVSTWEMGTAEPRMGALQRIATHFGISVASIIDDDQPLSKTESKLLRACREMNEEGQEKLVDYADDLLSSGKYKKTDPVDLGKEA